MSSQPPDGRHVTDFAEILHKIWDMKKIPEPGKFQINRDFEAGLYLYINLDCLSVCLFVCLYPINVKTAEPIGPKFFVGHHVTTGKVYD